MPRRNSPLLGQFREIRSAAFRGRESQDSHLSRFSCGVKPPLQLIQFVFNGLGLSQGVCGKVHVCGILTH